MSAPIDRSIIKKKKRAASRVASNFVSPLLSFWPILHNICCFFVLGKSISRAIKCRNERVTLTERHQIGSFFFSFSLVDSVIKMR